VYAIKVTVEVDHLPPLSISKKSLY